MSVGNYYCSRLLLPAVLILLFGKSGGLHAQAYGVDTSGWNRVLRQVETDILYSRLDEAYNALDSLYDLMEDTGLMTDEFGLQIRLQRGIVLEDRGDHTLALEELLYLVESGKERSLHYLVVEGSIQLELLYEYTDLPDRGKAALNTARRLLDKHPQLEKYRAWYAVRKSSFQRIFAKGDSTLYYAKMGLEFAEKYQQPRHLRDAHLLLSTNGVDLPLEQKIYHRKQSTIIAKRFNDLTAVGYNLSVIGQLYFMMESPEPALRYLDSAEVVAMQFAENNHIRENLFAAIYEVKSDVFQMQGQLDSSRQYLVKSYETKLAIAAEKNLTEVAELDARFQIDRGKREIKQQREIIESERKWSQLFQLLLGLLFMLVLGVLYFYYRLRRANAETKAQNLRVADKNDELSVALQQQKLLQSEVHHRVKNNLQVIISLLDIQQENIEDESVRDKLNTMSSRIFSMAAVHDILYQQDDVRRIALDVYVAALFEQIKDLRTGGKEPRLYLSVHEISLGVATCMPVGIMLTELMTNSIKHGNKQEEALMISIDFRAIDKQRILLKYRDNGPGFKNGILEGRAGGLGEYLLRSMVHQLKGSLRSFNDSGANVEIKFERKQV